MLLPKSSPWALCIQLPQQRCGSSMAELHACTGARGWSRMGVVGWPFWSPKSDLETSWNILKHLETSWNILKLKDHPAPYLIRNPLEWTLDGKLGDFAAGLSNLSDALATLRRPERPWQVCPGVPDTPTASSVCHEFYHTNTVHWFYMYPHMCKNTRLVEWGA